MKIMTSCYQSWFKNVVGLNIANLGTFYMTSAKKGRQSKVNLFRCKINDFFISKNFISNARLKLAKN